MNKQSIQRKLLKKAMTAVAEDRFDTVKQLVSQGLDVSTVNEGDNWNLLHLELLYSDYKDPANYEFVRYLITEGINVNEKDDESWTALHAAARAKDIKSIKLLLLAGAKVNVLNNRGESPLLLSMRCVPYLSEIIELLLEHGADPDFGERNRTPREELKAWDDDDEDLPLVKKLFDKYSKKKKTRRKKNSK